MSVDMDSWNCAPDLDAQQIRDALDRTSQSALFERNERLQAFLVYVVEEALEGRSALIRAKTIAQDVYLRNPNQSGYTDNIVRVDARRLRRLLDDYYATDGADDPVRITIETGGYVPSFMVRKPDLVETTERGDNVRSRRKRLVTAALALGAVVALVLGALVLFPGKEEALKSPERATHAERRALFEQSGTTLQAQNICDQGRALLFPIADPGQQQLASSLFRRAVELAPDFACGYAGAAHSLATLSIMAPEGENRDELQQQATRMAERALDLAPKNGWSVSAVGWAALAQGDLDRAKTFSKLSEKLSPLDGNVLDFYAVVSILTGDYEEARRVTNPARPRDTFGHGHAHRNIYGVATFHAGDYQAAITALNEAIEFGEPVSELTLVFLAAAHEALGDHRAATRYAQELMQTWPEFPADLVMFGFYPDDSVASELVDLLVAAGWRRPSDEADDRADAVVFRP